MKDLKELVMIGVAAALQWSTCTLTWAELAKKAGATNDEIAGTGILGSPALAGNGKIVAVGNVPSRSQLGKILAEAKEHPPWELHVMRRVFSWQSTTSVFTGGN